MSIFQPSAAIGRAGELIVGTQVFSAGHIFEIIPNNSYDGFIQFCENGNLTRSFCFVQVKSGDSYVRKGYDIKDTHKSHWKSLYEHSQPLIIVIVENRYSMRYTLFTPNLSRINWNTSQLFDEQELRNLKQHCTNFQRHIHVQASRICHQSSWWEKIMKAQQIKSSSSSQGEHRYFLAKTGGKVYHINPHCGNMMNAYGFKYIPRGTSPCSNCCTNTIQGPFYIPNSNKNVYHRVRDCCGLKNYTECYTLPEFRFPCSKCCERDIVQLSERLNEDGDDEDDMIVQDEEVALLDELIINSSLNYQNHSPFKQEHHSQQFTQQQRSQELTRQQYSSSSQQSVGSVRYSFQSQSQPVLFQQQPRQIAQSHFLNSPQLYQQRNANQFLQQENSLSSQHVSNRQSFAQQSSHNQNHASIHHSQQLSTTTQQNRVDCVYVICSSVGCSKEVCDLFSKANLSDREAREYASDFTILK